MVRNGIRNAPKYDYLLIIAVAALLIAGLMMVYSATFALGYQLYGQPTYFFIRQLLWMGVGLLSMIIIARIEKLAACGDTENSQLSLLISNDFADNIEKDRVHEIGRMMLDRKYGALRGDFTMVLCKIGGQDAIAYLRKGAADPEIASLSLWVLAKMRVEGTLELCEKALTNPRIRYKDAIQETYQKLKRRMAKKPAGPAHATSDPIPKALEEWSSNVDVPELSKVLRRLSRFVEAGFGKAEIAEVRAAAYELEVDETARFKFDAKAGGKTVPVWIEVFMDDENAPDLYIFSSKDLIAKLD